MNGEKKSRRGSFMVASKDKVKVSFTVEVKTVSNFPSKYVLALMTDDESSRPPSLLLTRIGLWGRRFW